MDPRESLRIALVTRAFSWEQAGGGEVMVRLLAEGLARLGHDVHVLAVDTRGVPGREAPFTLHPLPELSVAALRRGLREVAPDVVDVHNMEPSVPTLVAARTLGIPSVVTVSSAYPACLFADMYRPGHGICDTCTIAGLRDCFTQRPPIQIGRRVPPVVGYAEVQRRLLSLRLARRILVHSHASGELLARNGVPADRMRVIPNVDEPGVRGDAPLTGESILYVGALTRTKGVEVLLDAFAILAARRPAARLRLAGTGYLAADLRKRALDAGVAERVEFLGYVPHARIGALYQEARAVAFPSIAPETFGRVILEAWNAGVPLVAADLSAPGELVHDGVTGLLVPPEDPKALAEALERVLTDDDLARRLVANGRRELPRFAPEAVIPQFVQAYREAMAA